MRVLKAAVLTVLLCPGLAPAQAPQGNPIPKDLRGRWTVAHRYYTENNVTKPVGDLLTSLGMRLEFKQGKLVALDPDKEGTYLLVKFDDAKTPPHIDLWAPGPEDQVHRGIYRLDDGILTICVGSGQQRPKSFDHPDSNVNS